MHREIYCCGCKKITEARLTDGKEIYPHRLDLCDIPFWKCDDCGNYVGCHWKTKNPTYPLGNIPTPELRKMRNKIHSALDVLWKLGWVNRKELYKWISEQLGWKYHTAQIRSMEEAGKVLHIITGGR